MPADAHIIYGKRPVVYIIGKSILYHFKVACRPYIGVDSFFKAVAESGEGVIAEFCVGKIAAVICICSVVIRRGKIAFIFKPVAYGEGKVAVCNFKYT